MDSAHAVGRQAFREHAIDEDAVARQVAYRRWSSRFGQSMPITDTGAGPPQPAATASSGKSPGSVQPAPRAVATVDEVRDAS